MCQLFYFGYPLIFTTLDICMPYNTSVLSSLKEIPDLLFALFFCPYYFLEIK